MKPVLGEVGMCLRDLLLAKLFSDQLSSFFLSFFFSWRYKFFMNFSLFARGCLAYWFLIALRMQARFRFLGPDLHGEFQPGLKFRSLYWAEIL